MISEQKTAITTVGLIVFLLNDKEYSIEIENLLAILNPSQSQLDLTSKIAKVNYHEILFPVFSVEGNFLDKKIYASEYARILLLDHEGFSFGICVDKVLEVIRIVSKSDLSIDPSEINGTLPPFSKGIMKYENRSISIYDLEKVVKTISANIL